MENVSFVFTLLFVVFSAQYLEAAVLEKNLLISPVRMNWTDARTYCQQNHIDLVTWNTVDQLSLTRKMMEAGVSVVWLGLRRDPVSDSVWKWINVRTGIGITGDDVSNSSHWIGRQQGRFCAYVQNDLMWYSDLCTSYYQMYCSQGISIQFYGNLVTWDQASQFCKRYNMNLATVTANADYFRGNGWIGLYRVADEEWKWTGYQSYTYANWAPGQPHTTDCGCFILQYGKWNSRACSDRLFFACYDDNLVVVKKNKTWEQALSYCSGMTSPCYDPLRWCIYRYQLLSVQSSSDYSYVRDRVYTATTEEVWIGLRFLGGMWWWISGQMLDSQECPTPHSHCGTLSKNGADDWVAKDCSERKNFICLKYKSYT